jgi:hypothetical protein
VRQNPQVVTDLKHHQKMLGGHYMAIGTGIETESPAYFAAVERAIGRRGGGDRVGSSRTGGSDGRSVTLTPGEVKMATDGTLTTNSMIRKAAGKRARF